MSADSVTVATLPRISAADLSALLLAPSPSTSLAIIDVRDEDHIGGHIKTSKHVPSTTLPVRTPQLVRELQDKEVVVFHCALSQIRGPSAALRYVRERERLVGEGAKEQRVYVLRDGFVGWAREYGEDERLTEGYRKDLWKDEV